MKQQKLLECYKSKKDHYFKKLKIYMSRCEDVYAFDDDEALGYIKEIQEWEIRISMLRTLNLQE